MTTPEGKVKAKVKEIIAVYKPYVYSHWPVLNGMGAPTLDCIGSACGAYFAVETKAKNGRVTPRQLITMAQMQAAGAAVFLIDDDFTLREFDAWLHQRVMEEKGR